MWWELLLTMLHLYAISSKTFKNVLNFRVESVTQVGPPKCFAELGQECSAPWSIKHCKKKLALCLWSWTGAPTLCLVYLVHKLFMVVTVCYSERVQGLWGLESMIIRNIPVLWLEDLTLSSICHEVHSLKEICIHVQLGHTGTALAEHLFLLSHPNCSLLMF